MVSSPKLLDGGDTADTGMSTLPPTVPYAWDEMARAS